MAHPVHDILRRLLGSEQYAFETGGRKIWPWEGQAGAAPAPDETVVDEEPTQFDDVYPWLEPQN